MSSQKAAAGRADGIRVDDRMRGRFARTVRMLIARRSWEDRRVDDHDRSSYNRGPTIGRSPGRTAVARAEDLEHVVRNDLRDPVVGGLGGVAVVDEDQFRPSRRTVRLRSWNLRVGSQLGRRPRMPSWTSAKNPRVHANRVGLLAFVRRQAPACRRRPAASSGGPRNRILDPVSRRSSTLARYRRTTSAASSLLRSADGSRPALVVPVESPPDDLGKPV